jgi:DNA helicase HerA-like ATPase
MLDMMRKQSGRPTIERLREEVKTAGFEPHIQQLAESRLNLAERYIDDSCRLEDTLCPGRTVIVDLRDEWIEKEDALGLFVVILRIFERTMYHGEPFSKLIVFDEAHKYITDSKLIGEVVEAIRQIRHEQNTIVIASQDPLSVPRAVIELSTILVLHRMTSPAWVKHLRDTTEALKKGLDVAMLARLNPGEALVWCQRSSDMKFTTKPQLVRIRPRFTQHGGGTKTAVR